MSEPFSFTEVTQGLKSFRTAMKDYERMLSSGENSDVTIQVGEQEFKVHSCILLARYPALGISLRHESVERASNKIVIEDCESSIFREFLQHVYTGCIKSFFTVDNAFSLYRIADRYLADDLKQRCLTHLACNMRVATFCDIVRLAMAHGESDLLEKAIAFARKNIEAIVHSVEWESFICECPAEANEVLKKIFLSSTKECNILLLNKI